MARQSYLNARPDVARKVVRAYADAIHRYKTDEEFAVRVLTQYTQIDAASETNAPIADTSRPDHMELRLGTHSGLLQ